MNHWASFFLKIWNDLFGKGLLEVEVIDEKRQPVQQAVVTLNKKEKETTGLSGNAIFSELRGKYVVSVETKSCSIEHYTTVFIKGGEEKKIQIVFSEQQSVPFLPNLPIKKTGTGSSKEKELNLDAQVIESQASKLAQENLKAYCTLAFNQMLEEFEQKIESMEDGPKKDRAIERYKALEFADFFEKNQQDFFQTLKNAFHTKLWNKAETEEASHPAPDPVTFEETATEEPSSAALPPSSPSAAL